ncbi:MAG: D-alanyl-D-alanine carboxypeptidase [Lachnospiraceae bacterium]|nr:D-alanyl-D-alanine carboxypeptidase [Lachnospiraceae bacterium]
MADKQIRQQDNRQRAGGEPVRQSAGESSGDDRQARQRRAARSRRAAAARRRRERQIRIRMAILAVVFVVLAGGIGFAAFRIHRRNVMEQEAAAAASRKAAEEAAAEASRKAAEEAAEEASRKAAEEAAAEASRKAAAEASRKAAEEAAAEASRKAAEEAKASEDAAQKSSREKAEEEGALAASRKAAEEEKARAEAAKIPGLNASYDFKAAENMAEMPEEVESTYAVLVDLVDGTIVAGKEYDTVMNPASMTKILTLLVAVENIDLKKLDTDTFEITQDITDYVYTNQMMQVGWNIGDTPTIRSLLYGTILPSGADAALALAEYTAGSQEAFVDMMNKKLEELGISDTAHFTNVVGAYDEDHYCTALDMATILRAAIDNETCREVLSCHYYEVPPSGGEDSPSIEISNWFLRRIEDKDTHGEVICAKTGYVSESGFCAASYQESDNGGHYICVTADTYSNWACIYDHVDIYTAFTE